MGQYYKPINVDTKEWLYSHDFKYRVNKNGGGFFLTSTGLKLMEHSYIGNPFVEAVEFLLTPNGKWHKQRLVWAGDYASPDGKIEKNLYELSEEDKKIRPETKKLPKKYRYICNHTKKIFIDKNCIEKDRYGYKIHPLPLLTCEGNGLGGGDFRGDDARVGTWHRDRISIEVSPPEGFTEVDGNFQED